MVFGTRTKKNIDDENTLWVIESKYRVIESKYSDDPFLPEGDWIQDLISTEEGITEYIENIIDPEYELIDRDIINIYKRITPFQEDIYRFVQIRELVGENQLETTVK